MQVLVTVIGYLYLAQPTVRYRFIAIMTEKVHPVGRLAARVRRVFQRDVDPKTLDAIDALNQVSIFRSLPSGALRDLADAVHVRDYKRDEFLYYERDPGLGMYVVQRGRVRLLVEDETGTMHELRQVGNQEFFGKLSLLGDHRRTETAQAITETRVLGLFRPDLKTILKRHPGSGAAIIEAIARNLAAMETEIIRVLVEKDGKIEAMRMVDNAAARVDRISVESPVS